MIGKAMGAAKGLMGGGEKAPSPGATGADLPQFRTRDNVNDKLSADQHKPQRSKDPYKSD